MIIFYRAGARALTTRSRQIQSVERAMRLLEQLRDFPQGGKLAELCSANGLTKSTAHGLLDTLVELGYVTHQGNRYWLGNRVRALAQSPHDPARRIRELFSPALHAFNELCEADCFLAVASGTRSYLTLEAVDCDGVAFEPIIDNHRDALCTSAVGKVLLAHDEQLARRIRREGAIGRSLEGELTLVRNVGFAVDHQASLPGLNCMAISLRLQGQVVGALGTSGRASALRPVLLQLKAKRALRQLYDLVKC